MKPCPICGAPNPEDQTTCEQCGASLISVSVEGGVLCPVCGYRNPSGTIFCEQCGARLESAAMEAAEGPLGEAAPEAEAVGMDWVAALEELFPEIPSEAPPPAPEPTPAGAGEEKAPPAPAEPEERPGAEPPSTPPWEWLEEEPAPPAPEPVPWAAAVEETPSVFEPEGPPEEGSILPFEGIPPEIPELWPLTAPMEEEPGSFPSPDVPSIPEGEELPFPWLEMPGEALEQGPEASPSGTAPFIEWPLEPEGEPPTPSQALPFVGVPPERTEEIPERPAESKEAIAEAPYEPFEAWRLEEALTAEEIPSEEALPAQASVFLVQEELPAEAPSAPADVPPFTDLEAVLAGMPEWLQTLQPVPEEEAQAPAEAIPAIEPAVETRGPLAGLMDVLPLNGRLAEIQGPAARLRSEPAPELLTRAQAWQSLLDQGLNFILGERAAEPVPAGLAATLERWLLFALLIGALILGLYWPLPFFQPALLMPPADFLARLDQAPSGGIALIAVDYGPDRAAELEPYLQRILERLTARGVRVLTVSLSPWGAAQAAQVIQARPDYGERVVHLGYYPGQEVGVVRLLTRPLGQLRADYRGRPLQGLPVARDFGEDLLAARVDLVVLITGSPDALRGWIQQARGVLPPEVPVIAAVGANLAPYVAPYRESGQLHAVAIGLRDALLLDGPVPEGSPAFFDLQAQTVLQVSVIVLIGIGLAIRLLRRPVEVHE
ncbi:hypothetical protein HRbin22_01899 [Candidatus Thermoflexus japonica]|uniref:RanBP2-type domain-containing protein n=1 Tax=Candidatus Thermoflexus japonica TaxID=2035417 RepID=A0A2H5Y8A6_9CHLR|nr:hypothetical protein HRbin22_01899 [Candidatus Thermoflexus japonica]